MTLKVEMIRCSYWVPYDTDKMVATHTPISHGPVAIVSADDLEIHNIETQHDDPSDIHSIQGESQDCDPKEQLQDNKVDLKLMMIISFKTSLTTVDAILKIHDKQSHNDEQVFLKQCLCKDNEKVADLINLNQVYLSVVVPLDDKPMPKDPSHNKDSHPSENHKDTLFSTTMSDKYSQSAYSDDMYDDLSLKLEGSL